MEFLWAGLGILYIVWAGLGILYVVLVITLSVAVEPSCGGSGRETGGQTDPPQGGVLVGNTGKLTGTQEGPNPSDLCVH